MSDEGSKLEIVSRRAQTTAALTRLRPLWNDRSISLSPKIRLMCFLVTSIFRYVCESWTLTTELQRRMEAMGNEVLPQDTTYLIQRPCHQRGSPCQDPAGNRTTRKLSDRCKGMETEVVWTCLPFIRSGQNHLARRSERVQKTRQTEKRGGKTTSVNGQAWTSPGPREQWRRERK